ncbi:hypothetical protein E2C01_011412 [Portunus trituberculatus]|uniref:Uncharacterized protein n=1 Tax=Portunus trituberculatus TaxID=210409 RepID=A0A5B7DB03_PORTR|nr:hypothetical protein [Portunus trituberculatus]
MDDMRTQVCHYIRRSVITEDLFYPMEIPNKSVIFQSLSSGSTPTPNHKAIEPRHHGVLYLYPLPPRSCTTPHGVLTRDTSRPRKVNSALRGGEDEGGEGKAAGNPTPPRPSPSTSPLPLY